MSPRAEASGEPVEMADAEWHKLYDQIEQDALRQTGMRRFAKYLVFYRETQTGVIVERVLHGMRDLPLILDDAENR